MSKVDIKRLDSVTKNDTTATEQINDNFKALQAAIENTVSRDGTVPNYMDADLDLNSYRIINVGDPVGERDVVTLKYFEEKAGGAVEAAAEAKANASKAASSAQSALAASNNAIGQLAQSEGLLIAAEGQLADTKQYVDAAKADIDSAVDEAEMNISNIVTDAEGSITNVAIAEANKAIANAAQEATDTATANVNNYVNGTVKPSLQNYVNQAQEDANSAAVSMEQAALSATAASNYASNASADADNAAESAALASADAGRAANSAAAAATSANLANIQNKITNCIIKIPQDIKLELKNGTLTLKAGSKVYVPNGAGKFKVVTIASDIKYTYTYAPSSDSSVMLFINQSGTAFVNSRLENSCFSGETQPSGNYINWYKTNKNIMYSIGNNATIDDSGFSFPIARVIQGSDGVTKSIDQVFNGFGFIGSCLFALPGVKLLMPNGRNSDGSLNNFEYTTLNPAVSEERPGNNDYFLGFTSGGGFKRNQVFSGFYVSDSFISTSSQWCLLLNTTDNFYYSTGDYGATWNKYTILAQIGIFTGNNGKISQLNVRQPFHAVDYYHYAREVDNTVHKTGNETISGRKTFSGSGIGIVKSGSAIDIQNTAVDLSSTTISGTTEIRFIDKNGKVQGIFEHQNRTNGDSVVIMAARNHANTGWISLETGFDKNDTAFTNAPNPPSGSNNNAIATTSWVRNYSKNSGAQLNYSAAITISGTGEKTASVSGVLIGTPIHTNRSEQLKIIIGGKTFFFAPGNSGEDNNHISQCYLPIAKDQSYNVVEINDNVQLLLVPYV